MGQEPRGDVQTPASGKRGICGSIVRYLLSALVFGYEADNRGDNSDHGASAVDSQAISSNAGVNQYSNATSGCYSDGHPAGSPCGGWNSRVSQRNSEEGTSQYTSNNPKLSSVNLQFVISSSNGERHIEELVNDSKQYSGTYSSSTRPDDKSSSNSQSDDSSSTTVAKERDGYNGSRKRNDSRCTNGGSQDCVSASGSVVSEVYNQSNQAWATYVNNSTQVGENMSFFSKIGSFFKKVLGGEAKWERVVSSTLSVIAPILETVIGLTAGAPIENAVAGVINQVQSDLAAVNAVVTTSGGSTATAASLLTAAKTDLSQLLSAADIKNSTLNTQVSATVNLVIGEVEAMLAALPAATAVPATASATK